jgi:hypothetical protein
MNFFLLDPEPKTGIGKTCLNIRSNCSLGKQVKFSQKINMWAELYISILVLFC